MDIGTRAAAPAPEAAEHVAEDILEIAQATGASAGMPDAVRPERELLEVDIGAGVTGAAALPAAEALEAAKPRLALGVDLAAVEGLALVVLAEDLVGRIQLGKPLRRLGVVLVGVGMQLLGVLPKGALDRSRIRIPPNPQHFIGVAHRGILRSCAGVQPPALHPMWGQTAGFATQNACGEE